MGMATDPVQRVTSARASHSQEMSNRVRSYAIAMGIRTVCVIGFIVLALNHSWVAWIFLPAAVFLPYIAVLLANAGRERTPRAPSTFVSRPELPPAPAPPRP